MRTQRGVRKLKPRIVEDVILFTVAGTRLAIAASAVDEIRNLEDLTPFQAGISPRLAKVKYTLVRPNKDREASYFLVDACQHFRILPAKGTRILVLRDGATAVLVEAIDRMTQIANLHALPMAFVGEERAWYRGLAVVDDKVVPVVSPECFLSRGEIAVLQASLHASRALNAKKDAATA